MVRTQWQYTMAGRAGLNYESAIKIAESRNYDLEMFLDLLRAIEYAELMHDSEERKREESNRGAKTLN